MNDSPQLHVIVGAGPVGAALARQLTAAGHQVRVVTRSGGTDASDPAALGAAASGAAVLYNAANPSDYHRWQEIWPPLAASLLAVAEQSGAVLATVGNLYPYGPVDGLLSEDLPDAATYPNGRVRAQMWADALAAHQAGRLRTVEVRASDYLGVGAHSHPGEATRAVQRGSAARIIGAPDQPHTWTSTEDTARTLIAAAADPTAHGRTWIVPSNAARTQRELVTDLATAAGRPVPAIKPVSRGLLRLIGVVSPMMRTLLGTYYQFDRPFVVDDRAARSHFGIEPTAWATLIAAQVEPPVANEVTTPA